MIFISVFIMKYLPPKPMHWSGIHWWIDGLARPGVQELEHSWWGEVAQLEQDWWAMQTLPLSWNFMGLQEASAFTAPISLGFFFFFFKYTAAAPQIYSITQWHIFVLWPWGVSLSCSARNRQEVIRAASVTEMHPAAGMQLETPR